MNKYYEKLKCFFSLNYQLKKLTILSEGNHYFHVDIHVYKHIINPLLILQLLKILFSKNLPKSKFDKKDIFYHIRKSYLYSFVPHLINWGAFISIGFAINKIINLDFDTWCVLFFIFAFIDICYYIYNKMNDMFFYYKKICEEEDISDFEDWFNIFVSKNELETLNSVLKSGKSNSKKRL
jgi:hypothetical protein